MTQPDVATGNVLVPKTEAATRHSAHDCCKTGHVTVAKQVTRHLGGELATFPWDPLGFGALSTDKGQQCVPLPRRQNGGTGTQLPPCSLLLLFSQPWGSHPWPTSFSQLPLAPGSSLCPSCVPQISLSPWASLSRWMCRAAWGILSVLCGDLGAGLHTGWL